MGDVDGVWRVLDRQVASGRITGYAAGVRIGGRTAIRAGGRTALGADAPRVREDTLFRLASVTKPIGAALALGLVEDGALALDDPIGRSLPECARPRVLVAPDAPLERTTDARRPVTVRDLLAFTSGWGVGMADTPPRAAMLERGVHPGPLPIRMSADEFVATVAGLPLAFQPGEGWLYDTGLDLLGVLLARATGRSLSDLLAERVTGPLGMTSTAFWTSEVDRLAAAYLPGPNGLEVLDPPAGQWAGPPPFEELSSGLLSTAGDVLRFLTAMADGGGPVLSADSVALMTADALTDAQRAQARPIVGPGRSWGLGTAVDLEATGPGMAAGRWGWDGGTGTSARVDPSRDAVGILLTQRMMTGPQDGFDDFWGAVAAAT